MLCVMIDLQSLQDVLLVEVEAQEHTAATTSKPRVVLVDGAAANPAGMEDAVLIDHALMSLNDKQLSTECRIAGRRRRQWEALSTARGL